MLSAYPTATPEQQAEIVAAYRSALACQDWSYQLSDDYGAYCRGRDNYAQLQAARPVVDADYAIWNQVAPEEYRHRVACTVIRHEAAELFYAGSGVDNKPRWRALEHAQRLDKVRAVALIAKLAGLGHPVHRDPIEIKSEVAA